MRKSTLVVGSLSLLALPRLAGATLALQFDICPFETTADGSADHFVEDNFQQLDAPVENGDGHYLAMGTDAHRSEIDAAGNQLAVYYNSLSSLYSATNPDPAASAAALEAYCTDNFTSTGSEPDWIILNEISGSLWPTSATYRSWLTQTISILHNTYGHDVIIYAPFTTPGANASDWDSLASNAYIGVEDYISGAQMVAENYSVSWATGVYDSAKAYYEALGVPADRLMLGEEFGQSTSGTAYGRSGVSEADWNLAIAARDQAALDANYVGFLSYAWSKNQMLVPSAEQDEFEDTYMENPVLESEVPEPAGLALLVAAPLLLKRRGRAVRRCDGV